MTKAPRPRAAARPVLARPVRAGRIRPSIELRTGQDVVARRAVALFGELCLPGEIVLVGMQVVDVLRDANALDVDPGTVADTVAGVDRGLTARRGRAEIRTPRAIACSGGL